MYRITYSYYHRDKDRFAPCGEPITKTVEADTIQQLNNLYQQARDNHDVYKYTIMNFKSIEQI